MEALMMMGKPIPSTNSTTSSAVLNAPSLPGTTGTPASIAAFRADVLSANRFKFSTVGPTNVIPASSQAWANSGDSDRNPEIALNF
jgi:hypothetical protein